MKEKLDKNNLQEFTAHLISLDVPNLLNDIDLKTKEIVLKMEEIAKDPKNSEHLLKEAELLIKQLNEISDNWKKSH